MIRIQDKAKCSGCHSCYNACPNECISIEKDAEGFLYPKVDSSKCTECGLCDRSCPILFENNGISLKKSYAAYNNDLEERISSSSGGIFPLFAKYIVKKGGVVFGASFDEKFNVSHICVENEKELERLRGSKYVQSSIGKTYLEAKKFLDEGRLVYFSGTPCQIEGLLSFLRKDYDNLITQDIICHGVPSPFVWELYKNKNHVQTDFSFRDKSSGWSKYSYRINGKAHLAMDDSYLIAFISGLSMRPSCFECKFKKYNRLSDITLGDLWGADIIAPEMNDDKGLSAVILNTNKGIQLFESINCVKKDISFEDIITNNPSFVQSSKKPKKREKFLKRVNEENFDNFVSKYSKESLFGYLVNSCKIVAGKIFKRK